MVFKPQKNHFDFVLVQHRSLAQNAVSVCIVFAAFCKNTFWAITFELKQIG